MRLNWRIMLFVFSFFVFCISLPSKPLAQDVYEKDWWFKKMRIDRIHDLGFKGTGVKIAVFDTGIRTDIHNDMNVIKQLDCFNVVKDEKNNETCKEVNKTYEKMKNYRGHGTRVASVISGPPVPFEGFPGFPGGVAPKSEIYDVRVLPENGGGDSKNDGTYKAIELGLRWAIDNKIDIINMSLSINEPMSDDIKGLIKEAYDKGIILVASTGNNNTDQINYPAQYFEVIAVGGIEANDKRWDDTDEGYPESGSNYGGGIDFVAPAKDFFVKDPEDDSLYSTKSGTSYATPLVSGIIALYKERYPDKTSKELEHMLQNNAQRLGTPSPKYDNGYNTEFGYGLVQLFEPYDYIQNKLLYVQIDDTMEETGYTEGLNYFSEPNDNSFEDNYYFSQDIVLNFIKGSKRRDDGSYEWYLVDIPGVGQKWVTSGNIKLIDKDPEISDSFVKVKNGESISLYDKPLGNKISRLYADGKIIKANKGWFKKIDNGGTGNTGNITYKWYEISTNDGVFWIKDSDRYLLELTNQMTVFDKKEVFSDENLNNSMNDFISENDIVYPVLIKDGKIKIKYKDNFVWITDNLVRFGYIYKERYPRNININTTKYFYTSPFEHAERTPFKGIVKTIGSFIYDRTAMAQYMELPDGRKVWDFINLP